jgi:predicted RecB family endonuclease
MSNTNQHDRHVEILAEEIAKERFITTDLAVLKIQKDDSYHITSRSALSAIQRAVEECVKPLTEDEEKELEQLRECVKDPTKAMSQEQQNRLNFLAYKEWNTLNVYVDSLKSEVTTLRTELERVRGEYKIQRLTHQLFCGKVADQLGFERTVSLMKQSKEEITCGLEGGGDGK